MPRSFFADFVDDIDFLDVIQCAVLAGQKHAAACPKAAREGFSIIISDEERRPIYEVLFRGNSHALRRLTVAH